MDFYACLIILTELLMFAMFLHVFFYSGFTKTQKTWYLLTFAAVMVCAGCEYAVHCGYYSPSFAIPLSILTVIQFSVAPLLAVLFTAALGMPHQGKAAIIFGAVNLLTQTVAAPFKLVFYFDDAGYHRGDAFIIYTVFYIISLAYLVVNMVLVGRRFGKRDLWTIGMVLVVLVAGIVPMTVARINITYFAIAIAACLCYIYYNDLVQQDIQSALVAEQAKISSMQTHMISGLANFIENRDYDTGEHITRTSSHVRTLAMRCREEGVYADVIDDHFITLLHTLAPMHDIGKIIVPDSILQKPGKLTPEEYEIMKRHASMGGTIVREVLNGITDESYLTFASDIATYHHERWDGKGYPKGLKGEEIPLCARIMAIADVFDALVSKRCYKEAMPPEEAFKIIEEESGSHFDPKLVKVFLKHKEEFIPTEKNE